MEQVNCPLCKANDALEIMSVYDWYNFNGGPFTFVRCQECGLTYLNPRPSGSELLTYNHTMWERWSVTEESRDLIGSPELALQTYPEIIDELIKRKPEKGKLLEVGSGQGGFLKACQMQGWDVYGLDISEECIAYVRNKHGIKNALVADLLDAGYVDNQFDVVILNHLIEHLANPQEYIKEIHRILKPTGILCISTPNIDGQSAKIFGKYWQGLFVPLHLVLFTPDTLARMLQETKFIVSGVSHFSRTTNAYIWVRSLSCITLLTIQKVKNLLLKNNRNNGHVSENNKKESRARVIFRSIRPILYGSVYPILFIEGVIKRGASIIVYATPIKPAEEATNI